jgi:hypothetical protein
MSRSRRTVILVLIFGLILGLAILAGLAVVLFAPLLTYREVQSPDGEFTLVAKSSLFYALVPRMPGQAGDKPGRVIVLRKDGQSCGSAAIDMVWMAGDVRWGLGSKPREASIVGTARWNLDACTVEASDR